MHALILIGISVAAGLIVGTLYGRKLEQEAVGAAIAEYHQLGRLSASVIGELKAKLPWLTKHL